MKKRIKIIACPPGQAPEEVRQAWIGLEMPLSLNQPPRGAVFRGVLNGAPERCNVGGFAVDGRIAIEMLQQKNPTAAEWWKKNAPQVFKTPLVFSKSACQLVD